MHIKSLALANLPYFFYFNQRFHDRLIWKFIVGSDTRLKSLWHLSMMIIHVLLLYHNKSLILNATFSNLFILIISIAINQKIRIGNYHTLNWFKLFQINLNANFHQTNDDNKKPLRTFKFNIDLNKWFHTDWECLDSMTMKTQYEN